MLGDRAGNGADVSKHSDFSELCCMRLATDLPRPRTALIRFGGQFACVDYAAQRSVVRWLPTQPDCINPIPLQSTAPVRIKISCLRPLETPVQLLNQRPYWGFRDIANTT
jgi:hypothetical protein